MQSKKYLENRRVRDTEKRSEERKSGRKRSCKIQREKEESEIGRERKIWKERS